MKHFALILLALFFLSSNVYAQTPADVDNPSAVAFNASPDHSAVDGYELDILRPDGSVLQTLNIGKPAPDASNVCTTAINVQPIAFASGYSIRVRTRAGTAVSTNALSVNKFNRVPGAPSNVIIRTVEE